MSSKQNKLARFVEIYRKCDFKGFDGVAFTGELAYQANIQLIKQIRLDSYFDEEIVDEKEVVGDLPDQGDVFKFKLTPPAEDASQFYHSYEDLLKSSSVVEGDLPSEFYIVEADFYSSEAGEWPREIKRLDSICELIRILSETAQYHDKHNDCLIFIGSSKQRPLELQIDLSVQMLRGLPLSLNEVSLLGKDTSGAEDAIHVEARRDIFRTTLCDFLLSHKSSFMVLVSEWDGLYKTYMQNLGTYLSNFRFDKVRREIANYRLSASSDISNTISSIISKVLATPVSFVGVAALMSNNMSVDNIMTDLLLVIGLLVASTIVAAVVSNQESDLKNLVENKLLFSLSGTGGGIPSELVDRIEESKAYISRRSKDAYTYLLLFHVLSWTPVIVGVSIFSWKYVEFYSLKVFVVSLVILVAISIVVRVCFNRIYQEDLV